jgi:2-keto-3-deoxy-L-rhamnonate aldolase RhmA
MPKDASPGLKAKIKAGKPLIGSYVTFTSPEVVELFAHAGMDYVVIDLQHSSPDWQTLAHMLRAADAGGTSSIVRVNTHEPSFILKVLEMGAEGISLPGVQGAEDIRAAVDTMYYQPIGNRGACGHTRAGGYNSRRSDFPEHVRRQNERVCIWAIVEDTDAIGKVGDIAAVRPGADVISVGRGDLSTALGLAGQINHPDVIAANERVIKEVQTKSGGQCASGAMIQSVEDIAPWYERGCRLFTYAADAILLMNAARGAVDAFRSALPAK